MNTSSHLLLLLFGLLLSSQSRIGATRQLHDQHGFDQDYVVTWGADHVKYLDNGVIQLSMDKSSGAGFSSKMSYNTGFFHLSMKTPKKDTAGVVTAFYLSSNGNNHDELDFEFLGNRPGKPVTFQTNVFTNGHGNREQRLHLWFDPSEDFHDYKVLWNPYHIVFFVDDVPVRVYRNLTSKGVEYPSQPMKIYTSLWNGEDWATNGGKDKINWRDAPFMCQFNGFSEGIDGCSSAGRGCDSSDNWWNAGMYKELTPQQESAYRKVKKSLTYDYCADKPRFSVMPPECGLQ